MDGAVRCLNMEIDRPGDVLINPVCCCDARNRPGINAREGVGPGKGQRKNGYAD